MPIVRKDSQFTTILCDKCELAHKVLNDKFVATLKCPYCARTISLTEGKSSEAAEKVN